MNNLRTYDFFQVLKNWGKGETATLRIFFNLNSTVPILKLLKSYMFQYISNTWNLWLTLGKVWNSQLVHLWTFDVIFSGLFLACKMFQYIGIFLVTREAKTLGAAFILFVLSIPITDIQVLFAWLSILGLSTYF